MNEIRALETAYQNQRANGVIKWKEDLRLYEAARYGKQLGTHQTILPTPFTKDLSTQVAAVQLQLPLELHYSFVATYLCKYHPPLEHCRSS